VYKKRWYDGLHDIYEDKNEFEIKFGCFGGDGGSKGGPTTDPKLEPKPTSTPTPSPDDGFRGEQSATAASQPSVAETAAAAAAAGLGSGYGPGTKTREQLSSEIRGKVADAVAASQRGPVSLDTSMQNMTMDQALGLNVPTVSEQLAPTQAGLPGTTVAPAARTLADMYANAQSAVTDQVMNPDERALAAAREAIAQGRNPFATSTKDDLARQLATPNVNRATQNYLDYQTNAPAQLRGGPQSGLSISVPAGASLKNPGLQFNFSTPIGPQASATPDITQSGIMNALGIPDSYQTATLASAPVTSPINDPTAQAGIGSFFTETIPGVFGYTTPAKAKSSKAKAKSNADRFKGSRVRTKPTGFGEYFTNLFTG